MNIVKGAVRIPRVLIFVAIVATVLLICLWLAGKFSSSPLIFSLMTGLVGGLSIFLLDKLIEYRESVLLGARDWILLTLRSRDDKAYYSKLIEGSTARIYFFGKTGRRLLTDFADVDAVDKSNKWLLEALERGVKIRFLLADKLSLPSEDQRKCDEVTEMISRLQKRAGTAGANFEFRYYKIAAAYSLFVADETVIFGANFPTSKSRATPSVVSDSRGSVARSYMAFFDEQWEVSKPQ